MNDNAVEKASPNADRLLWAGFVAILAAGIGFAVRGGILLNWGSEFGFSNTELGKISGTGLTGFCFGIIIGGLVADIIGYGWLVVAAFALHVISAVVTLAATEGMPKETAYLLLYCGTFIFAIANGTLEAVANPLVATLFPHNRTHYLNILHASWPAGLIAGGLIGAILGERLGWGWKPQLALYLVPTALYGVMFWGQKMPKSEASEKGLSLGGMFKDVGILGGLVVCALLALFLAMFFREAIGLGLVSSRVVAYAIAGAGLVWIGMITNFSWGATLLFILFIAHALVGSVELGTDNWIQYISGIFLTPETGKWLFVYTSAIMFLLRFCADFIEKRLGLSPVGILLVCSILAMIGLNLISIAQTTVTVMLALLVYGVGKTFFWPTMLAVASDRFPRTGAVAISIMGGIGMMSAGLIGSPGLGYLKDRFASESLEQTDSALYAEYKAEEESRFLFLESAALDGKKLGDLKKSLANARKEDPSATMLVLPEDQQTVLKSDIQGDRWTLRIDSLLPATMAVIYLGLMIYFKSIGGYKPVHIDERATAT